MRSHFHNDPGLGEGTLRECCVNRIRVSADVVCCADTGAVYHLADGQFLALDLGTRSAKLNNGEYDYMGQTYEPSFKLFGGPHGIHAAREWLDAQHRARFPEDLFA